jgi:hypothetical protein
MQLSLRESNMTRQSIESLVQRMNQITGIDRYYLQGAYGGWDVFLQEPEGTGATPVFNSYSPKKLLIMQINCWLMGYQTAMNNNCDEFINSKILSQEPYRTL